MPESQEVALADKILVKEDMRSEDFDSDPRRDGINKLRQRAEVVFYPGELTAADGNGVVAVIASAAQVHPDFYDAAPNLRIISRYGVGFEKVNIDLATERGVLITVASDHVQTVAEYTIAQWMATLKRLYTLNRNSHGGDFRIIRNYEANGSTLGLYGFGRIGQHVARMAKPLLGDEGRLLVYDIRSDIADVATQFGAEAVEEPEALFRECDTVSLHVAGGDQIVDYDRLCSMKPHATLLNPSRASLVDDEAALRALNEDRIFYYVLDDPVSGAREIFKDHPRAICTNHSAGITVESAIRLDLRCVDQVVDTLEGRTPANVLNTDVMNHPRVKEFLRG